MTLTSKDEYLEKSSALATGFGPTVDFTDPQIGTTVQAEGGVPTSAADLPGQVFSVDQLPDPAVAVAYGLPPVRVPAHLILDDADNALKHVQGKDALDVINGQLREELGDPVLAFDNTVRSADDALGHFNAVTGPGLGAEMEDGGEPFVDGIKGGDGESTTSGDGIEGPIDPEGVQRGPGGEPVSEAAGTQGHSNTESGDPEQKDPAEAARESEAPDTTGDAKGKGRNRG